MNTNFEWTGRVDKEDGDKIYRWHNIIERPENIEKAVLGIAGFPCDIGVARNLGRTGAANAPNALRSALCNMAWRGKAEQRIIDFGDVAIKTGEGDSDPLQNAQEALAQRTANILENAGKALILGGGHETALGSFSGLHHFLKGQNKNIGILNLDAHFDIRLPGANGFSSGTPFTQIRDILKNEDQDFQYMVLGVSEIANTQALFERACTWGVDYIFDRDVSFINKDFTFNKIDAFLEKIDVLYLTLDLDVLPHWQMPAVSAPAGHGVDIGMIEAIISHLGKTGKPWPLSDIVEFNPDLDEGGNAARTAARLIDSIAQNMLRNPLKL